MANLNLFGEQDSSKINDIEARLEYIYFELSRQHREPAASGMIQQCVCIIVVYGRTYK
jgi:hypothetical protein